MGPGMQGVDAVQSGEIFHDATLIQTIWGCKTCAAPAAKAKSSDPVKANQMLKAPFLDAMSRHVSSVTIVTTDGPGGMAGATVSAMTSVSADGDAPTLLVCLHHETSCAPAIVENSKFCVNILAAAHEEIANVFASRVPPPGGDKFAVAAFAPMVTGAPALSEALASFDCALKSYEQIGTHFVMIGALQGVQSREGTPLLYGNRDYRSLA